jgi:hypothetical protein
MLLPVHAALGTRTAVVATPSVVVAVPARTIEFRPLTKLSLSAFAILARTRETRTLVSTAAIIAVSPRLLVASVAPPELTIAIAIPLAVPKFPILKTAGGARIIAVATRSIIAVAARSIIAIAARRPIVTRRARAIGTITTRAVSVLSKAFATRRVGALVAVTLPRRVWLLVAELPIRKTRGRTGAVALAAGLEAALLAIAVTRGPIAERPVTMGTVPMGTVVTAEPRPVATSLAIELFRTEAALGELLVRPPRLAGTALAAVGTVAPAAGIIVSVVIAGHERARSRDQMAMGAPQAAPNSRKTGLDFC